MSPVSSSNPGWFARQYDRLLLVLVLILLLASSLFLVLQIGGGRKKIEAAAWEKAPVQVKRAQPLDSKPFDLIRQYLRQPFQTGEHKRELFVSELRVASVNPDNIPYPIPYAATNCPFTGYPQPHVEEWDSDFDGMPDSFERAHGLDPKDPEDARADLDGDGYSNLEEFRSKTNPADARDFPSPVAKLRLLAAHTNPFMFKFEGVQELAKGARRFQINLRSKQHTYFVKLGEVIDGYKVDRYEKKIRKGPYGNIDESVLTLRHGDEQIKLVKGKEISQHEWAALLVWLVDRRRIPVRVDQTFPLKGRKYKVIDINTKRVLIRDSASGELKVIKRISDAERLELSGGSDETAGSPEAQGSAIGLPSKTPAVRRPAKREDPFFNWTQQSKPAAPAASRRRK